MDKISNLNKTGYEGKRTVKNSSVIMIILIFFLMGILMISIVWLTRSIVNNNNITRINRASKVLPGIVTVSKSGFNPSTINIKVGQAVQWKNSDTLHHWISSDPYPSNDGLKELSSNTMLSQDSYTFVFNKPGIYPYHDNLNPYKFRGEVIVK